MTIQKKIGFFDSGVGGLSVLKEALNKLSGYSFIYIGDTDRMPYGVKTSSEVEQFTLECIDYIGEIGIDSCIIACNTATAYGLKSARDKFDFKIFGVVEPACESAVEITNNNKVALFATQGTVNSKIYDNTMKSISQEVELVGVGCPDLVLAIENGHIDDCMVKKVIEEYLMELGDFEYDTLILGCTHFPLAIKMFKKIFSEQNKKVNIVDPAEKTIEKLKSVMQYDDIARNSSVEFYATGDVEKFKSTVCKVIDIDKIDLSFKKAVLNKFIDKETSKI